MATLAEGVARLMEKQIAALHSRQVDDVTISVRPPGLRLRGGGGAAAAAAAGGSARVIQLEELPGEQREAVDVLLRQETNRAAFQKMYRQRVSGFRQAMQAMEEDVARELETMPRPEVVVGVRNRADTQIVIARAAQHEPAADAATAAPTPPAPRTKGSLRDGLVWASGRALAELGVNPDQPFNAGLAVQALSHPQLRPLVLVALPEGLAQAAARETEAREHVGEEGAADPSPAPLRKLTRNSRPRRREPLVKVSVKHRKSS